MRLSATFRDPAVMLALYRGGAVGEWASLPGRPGGAGGPFGAGPAVILLPGWKPVASSSLGRVARGQDELGGEPLRGMKSTGSGRTALREAAAALRGQSWTSGRSSWHQDVTFIRRSAGWRIRGSTGPQGSTDLLPPTLPQANHFRLKWLPPLVKRRNRCSAYPRLPPHAGANVTAACRLGGGFVADHAGNSVGGVSIPARPWSHDWQRRPLVPDGPTSSPRVGVQRGTRPARMCSSPCDAPTTLWIRVRYHTRMRADPHPGVASSFAPKWTVIHTGPQAMPCWVSSSTVSTLAHSAVVQRS